MARGQMTRHSSSMMSPADKFNLNIRRQTLYISVFFKLCYFWCCFTTKNYERRKLKTKTVNENQGSGGRTA